MLGMYLWWGKHRLVTSRSRPGLVVILEALGIARLSVVASPFAILPPSPSWFSPLAPYSPFSWHLTARTLPLAGTLLLPSGWHPTATPRLAPNCYSRGGTLLLLPRSVDPSSLTPSRGIALPAWLLSHALDRCNDLHDRVSGYSGPTVSVFSPVHDHLFPPLSPAFLVFEHAVSFVLGSLLKGLGLSTCTFLCIVSPRVSCILS